MLHKARWFVIGYQVKGPMLKLLNSVDYPGVYPRLALSI